MIDIVLQYAFPKKQDSNGWVAIFFFLPFIIGIPWLIYRRVHHFLNDPFQFDLSKRLNQDKLLTAYICLSARLIKSDPRDAGEKVLYMNSYFSKHFPDEREGFSEMLTSAYSEEINFTELLNWIKVKLPAHKDRIQIIYFLVGLAFIDGQIIDRELNVLYNIAERIEITPKEMDSILAMYQSNKNESQRPKSKLVQKNELKISSQILGVSEHASLDEIKKAYRSLVKLHHPDRFFNEGPEQQKIAHERFMHIQKAYELLENLKKTV